MIVYLHGFNSAGTVDNQKVIDLQKIEDVYIVTYDSFASADEILKSINEDIADIIDPVFIGTSLGGYFAAHLAKEWDAPSVLINPATNPEESLSSLVGIQQTNYITGEKKTLSNSVLTSYSKLPDLRSGYATYPLVIVAEDDTVIDPVQTKEFFSKIDVVSVPFGGHQFSDLRSVLAIIETYINLTAFAADINS